LIDWVSKKQAMIETSVFGAEFVAMKHGIEKLMGLRYKLCMMGIPLTGPSFIYGDNKSQITNSTKPELTLNAMIETSVFGAEFFAMKHGIEKLMGLRYKLCMMGIPLTGPSFIYGDNKSQITNSTKPESTLKKKCNSICYHAVRESVAMGESRIPHISTHNNLSDLMTKVTHDAKCRKLIGGILYDIFDDHLQQ
jgi:hypothetical protein